MTNLTEHTAVVFKHLGHPIQKLNGGWRRDIETTSGTKEQTIFTNKKKIYAIDMKDRRRISFLPEFHLQWSTCTDDG